MALVVGVLQHALRIYRTALEVGTLKFAMQ